MEIVGAVVIGILLPSVKKLVNSLAYRNEARGKAEIIRARREARETVSGRGAGKGSKRGRADA
ncbi:hypothetical protein ACWEQJ_29640 [Streptomyces cyaneofuscatus]